MRRISDSLSWPAWLAVFLLLPWISGCANNPANDRPQDADLVAASYAAAEKLVESSQVPLTPGRNIMMAPFVSIDSLENSSSLGRIIAEQVSSRLTQMGFTMIELKLRDNIFIKQSEGEFMLSRELRSISHGHDAQAVVTGTYAVGQDAVFVNARVIRPQDSVILSSYDYVLPLGSNTRTLLRRASSTY